MFFKKLQVFLLDEFKMTRNEDNVTKKREPREDKNHSDRQHKTVNKERKNRIEYIKKNQKDEATDVHITPNE